MRWFVRRRADNSIASTYSEIQPNYAEEALDDTQSVELIAYFQRGQPADPSDSDALDKVIKAVLYAAGGMAGKTPAQTRAAFKAAWQAL